MNIEESIKEMKSLSPSEEAIETLLTAYEKEKGENVKLRLQDIPLIEGELKAYKDRVNELKQEVEKEKEKNKELEFALLDMVFQFADRPKIEGCHYGLATMGLSALENAFNILNFDEVEPIVRAEKGYNELLEWRNKQC